MQNAVPRVLPAAAFVGVFLAWALSCDIASAAKPRDFGSGARAAIGHTASPASTQTTISNATVCGAQYDQFGQCMVPDGSGNSIDVWTDYRNGNLDIYAQKLNSDGMGVWTADGLPVCKDLAQQTSAKCVADGTGGAIVVWVDSRSGANDIYAQRLDTFGTPLWTANGVAVCTAVNDQLAPVIVSDGVGGAIIAWTDDRAAAGSSDLYAQRLNSSGVAQWTANGIAFCTAAGIQQDLSVGTDASQGAYFAWQDQRASAEGDIYGIRVTAAGVPQGTANGTALCTLAGVQETPVVVADGAGGVIVGWADHRGTSYDIYAQRMNSSVQWASNGVPVSAATGDQRALRACTDAVGGAYFTWQDNRAGANTDLYAQRLGPTGTAMWVADGISVCLATADQLSPVIQRDPAGGALIAWSDARSATTGADVYAQRINGAGAAQWTADGVRLCDAPNAQDAPVLVPDGVGGALVAWHDLRGAYADLYGQRIDVSGQIGSQCVQPDSLQDSVVQTLTAAQNYKFFYNQTSTWPDLFWCGVGVRGAAGSDWDIEGYDQQSYGLEAYPSCFGNSLAGSFGSGSVDMIVMDENDGHTPPGTYGFRPFRYSGTGNATLEADGGLDQILVSTNADPNHPVSSPANWTDVLDVYDVSLIAGVTYTFDLVRAPSNADIRLLLFSSASSADYYYVVPRSARLFELTGRYYQFTAPATTYYGVVLVNETGAPAQYTVKVWSDTPPTGLGEPPATTTTGIEGILPNPAHGRAQIKFSMHEAGEVSFDVLDMAGRVVSRIPSRHWQPGVWSIDWDGRADGASPLSAGIYFVQMQVNGRRMGLGRVALIQ